MARLKTALRHRVSTISSAILILTALVGCTHQIPLNRTTIAVPQAQKLDVSMGVYVSREFQTYKHSENRYGDIWAFPLGEASKPLLESVFSSLFETSAPVNRLPPLGAGSPNFDGVIEPKFESFSFDLPFLKTGLYTAEITYRFTIHSANGTPVASWTITGIGEQRGQVGLEFARWPGEAAVLAMKDAANKLVSGFRQIPEVRAWLRRLGKQVSEKIS